MDYCRACDLELYEDDRLNRPDDGSDVWTCRDCYAKSNNLPPPERPFYPIGNRVPTIGDGFARRDIAICCVCRHAMRSNESHEFVRITEEDALTAPDLFTADLGMLLACPRCFRAWRPIIVARLKRLGVIAQDVPEEHLSGRQIS